MRSGSERSVLVLRISLLIWIFLTRAEARVSGRKARQIQETEGLEASWGPWSPWGDCSQTCGMGVSDRRRRCLPKPRTSHSWELPAFLPPGLPNHTPVVSAIRPHYPSQYPLTDTYAYSGGERRPFYSPSSSANQNARLPVFRHSQGSGLPDQARPEAPLSWRDFPPYNQGSVYRPPSFPSSSINYGQVGRSPWPPDSEGTGRVTGGGTRRSVPANQDGVSPRRPVSPASSIRPGQFGYGRMPFSLPLHRQNRQARHSVHGGNNSSSAAAPEEAPPAGYGSTGPAEPKEHPGAEEDWGEVEPERQVGAGEGRSITSAGLPDPGPDERVEPGQATTDGRSIGLTHRHPDEVPPGLVERDRPAHFIPRVRTPPHPSREWQPERRAPSSNSHPAYPPFWQSVPHREPLYSFAPPLPPTRPLQLPPGLPSNPNIWLLPPQQPGEEPEGGGEAASELRPAGGRWRPGSPPPRTFKCSGPEKEYRRCSSQVCPGGAVDPRVEQCSSFNSQEFMGRLYDWEPFTEVGAVQQCELTCRPAGFRFYVRQADAVRDGTPCVNSTVPGVCVGGHCLSEGCDGILGSGLVRDRCGVCGGRDASCRRVSATFNDTSVPLGYHHILDIPVGATAINITERKGSPNYLALRSGTGQSVVNGRWAVDPPGEYQAGGTTFSYSRPRASAEGRDDGAGETLMAAGPTSTLLKLYIIHHRKNPGIDYEFYIPVESEQGGEQRGLRQEIGVRSPVLDSSIPGGPPPALSPAARSWAPEQPRAQGLSPSRNARIPPRTDLPLDTQPPFIWRRDLLTECSASCGKGTQHRVVYCVNRHTEQEVPEMKCDSATKPDTEEPCNLHPCPPFWEVGSWSDCSVTCGSGLQQRQVQCRQSFGNRSTMVHPQRCSSLVRPNATQPCHPRVCSHWEIGTNWSACSVDCGSGKRTRSVRCVSNQGNIVSDRECNTRLRPQGTEDCHMGPCITNWYFTDWTQTCSAQCGPGIQRREVLCLSSGGGGGDCMGEKPLDMKACNGGRCLPVELWYTGPWSPCSSSCGNGTQRRDVICVQKLGSDFNVTPPASCAHLEKPALVQTCEVGPCGPQWFTTEWSACSRSCGRGSQTREVRCLTVDRRPSLACDASSRPEREQPCNTLPCGPQVSDENCKDKRHNCMMVVQARLCVYSYYKTACCASCSQSTQRARRQ